MEGSPAHFDLVLGTEWVDDDPDHAVARVPVREELRQPFGLLHGGVMSSVIESVCSRVTFLAVAAEEKIAMGQAISVNFVRPVAAGFAEVRARARHRGRTTWVWEADVVDAEGRLCAQAQMTIAVRPRPGA